MYKFLLRENENVRPRWQQRAGAVPLWKRVALAAVEFTLSAEHLIVAAEQLVAKVQQWSSAAVAQHRRELERELREQVAVEDLMTQYRREDDVWMAHLPPDDELDAYF